ncbi:MAG: hypothetical protein K0V04_13855 [Deltaproteobacteria bacterium]|nr:hypothetical protein [Deltaproteobacteria bacterium]
MGTRIEVGSQLEGRFSILDELASRDSRTVYFGNDTQSNTRCEIHVLVAGAASVERVAFTREAELLGRVDHPGCLRVASVGGLPDGTLYYIVAERASSRVTDRQGTRLPPFHSADAAAQLLRVLDHIHRLDWRLGWLTPDQVDERLDQGRLQVRIVRMPSARPDGQSSAPPEPDEARYAAAALRQGEPATLATELFTVGQLVSQLASGEIGIPLPHDDDAERQLAGLVDRLLGKPGTQAFASASAAADEFEQLLASWQGSIPVVPPVARTTGRSRFRTSDIVGIETRPTVMPVAAGSPEPGAVQARVGRPTSGGVMVEPAPSSLRRWAPAIAVGLIAVVGGVVFLSSSSGTPEPAGPATPTVAVHSNVPAAAAPSQRPAPVAAPAPEMVETAGLLDNPMRALAVLNRTDLGRVLGYVERQKLLGAINDRPDLRARVDMRWNRLLDLAQASDSPTPCTTFREALSELLQAPQNPAEKTLMAQLSVPTPETVLGAGTAPDGECTGLPEAFAEAMARHPADEPAAPAGSSRRSTRSSSRSRSHTSTKPASTPSPAKPTPASKDEPSVASRLEDDIKSVGF